MSVRDLRESVRDEAVLALRFAADKDGLSLHGVNVDLIASIVAVRVIHAATNTGAVVTKESHDNEVERLNRRVDQFSKWWAGAKVSAEAQLQRAQTALSDLDDRGLARRLADQIGVILPEAPDALFEPTP